MDNFHVHFLLTQDLLLLLQNGHAMLKRLNWAWTTDLSMSLCALQYPYVLEADWLFLLKKSCL